MTKQEFETFLDVKASETKTTTPIDWNARKQEWLISLKMLYDEVELWLKKYLADGRIRMERAEVTLEEEQIGKYRADSRVFSMGEDRVLLRPIGTRLIGTRGRVDMEGPKGTVKLILTGKHSNGIHISFSVVSAKDGAQAPARDPRSEPSEEWVWKIATPPPKVRFIELTAETFLEALMDVVNG